MSHASALSQQTARERIQRGKMALDVATVDLAEAEARLGQVHPKTWQFRESLTDHRRAWDRLRAEFGGVVVERELLAPPSAVIRLAAPSSDVVLIAIGGRTFGVEAIAGTALAPIQWRLVRLEPRLEFGPYYACKLADGTTQCDCAEWAYREDAPGSALCKHLAALTALGWMDSFG